MAAPSQAARQNIWAEADTAALGVLAETDHADPSFAHSDRPIQPASTAKARTESPDLRSRLPVTQRQDHRSDRRFTRVEKPELVTHRDSALFVSMGIA
jgi:hypothetical protein